MSQGDFILVKRARRRNFFENLYKRWWSKKWI